VWALSEKMLGSRGNPRLSAKGAETHGMLPWVVQTLEGLQRGSLSADMSSRGALLIASGRAALALDAALYDMGPVPTAAQQQAALDAALRHCALFSRAGGRLRPKHHLLQHMLQRARCTGSPQCTHTYHDESVNGIVATIARSTHRATFAHSVLRKYTLLQDLKALYS
jgi:hypothetical protein